MRSLHVRSRTATEYGDDLNALDAVPEPSAVMLLGLGAICLAGYAWRRRERIA